MSVYTTTSNEAFTMPARLRNLVQTQKLDIKINLHSRKKTYTTSDKIDGVVSVTALADTAFDAVEVEFVGTARTYVERLTTAAAVSGRAEAFHQFLKLTQPNLQDHYPERGILRAGQTYDFPFIFVIPQQLLPRVCQHKVHNPAVRDAHLLLPPTFGDDKDIVDEADDMAPDMASIRYGVFAQVSRVKTSGDDTYKISLASKARKVRVVPAVDEQPPLAVGGDDAESEYVMRKEKTIRKSVLKGKLGTLVMEAAQPQSLRLRAPGQPESRTTIVVTVMLRFDPTDENATPPRLGSMSSKIKVLTTFASSARYNFPNRNLLMLDLSQGLHTEQLNLSSRCMANVEWRKVDPTKPATIERRDSACSMTAGETPQPSSTYKGRTYYTARLLVPVSLPTNKAFVPTFHSCLISRIYQLKLDLGLHTAGIVPSMELKVPVQVSSEGNNGEGSPPRDYSDSEDGVEVDAEDASDFFEPRTVRAPSEGFVGRSRIGSQAPVDDAPPGYTPYNQSTTAHRRHMSVPA